MSDRPARGPHALLLVPAVAVALYVGAYGYARASHRLVRYGGGFIAGPHVTQGIGFTAWELAFAPLTWAEATARRATE